MSDLRFLDDLRAEFEHLGPPRSRSPVRSPRGLSAVFLLGISLLVVAGVMVAVLSVRGARHPAGAPAASAPTPLATSPLGTRSEPLSGTVPGKIAPWRGRGPVSVAGYGYSITVSPSLDAGGAGWTVGIAYRGPAFVPGGGGASAGGGYPTRNQPLLLGSGVGLINSGSPRGETVDFVITGPQVAAVRFGARKIATFASPELPAGDRAAVFFLRPGALQPVTGWRPGAALSAFAPQAPGQHLPATWLIPLDRAGRPIPTIPSYPQTVFSSFWQAPSAITPSIQEPPYHGPTRPRPGICELSQAGLPGLTPEWGHTVARIAPASDALGETFLSCVDTEYYLHGWPLRAAVLLDGRRPGQDLGSIPGAQPVSGYPGYVDAGKENLSARRVGNAWLAVEGGAGLAQRLRVLQALNITKLTIRH